MNETELNGIELLRYAVKLFNNCNESMNYEYTAEQLLNIAKAKRKCAWDVYPDQWTAKQRRDAAFMGKVPDFKIDSDGELIPR